MRVQAEISLYLLRTHHLGKPIERFVETLKEHELRVSVGAMSTCVEGENEEVFTALQKAFARVAEEHQTVLLVKLSNACRTRSHDGR